jgi:hypothetical protein
MAIFLKSSALNDDVFGKSQQPIKKFIMDTESAAKNEHNVLEQIFTMYSANTFASKFSSFTQKGLFSDVGENGAYPETEQQVGYSRVIEDTTWKNSFKVSKEMIEDANMFDVKKEASNFVASFYRTRSQYGASIINNGTATTTTFEGKTYNIACNDALSMFNIAHTSITGGTGTQSNYFDAGFSYDNLCRVEELMQKWKDDNGNYIDIQPDTIIIPNNARIKRLVADAVWTQGDQRPGTADHSFNYQAGRWNVITWNYLANPATITTGYDVWYLMDSRYNSMNGLMFCDRTPLEIKSYIDDNTDANIWGGRARFAAAPVDWRAMSMCAAGLGSSIA